MGLEAVEYVKQAEEKLEELRRNSQAKAKKIVSEAERKAQQNKITLEQELSDFEESEKEKYHTLLEADKEALAKEIEQESAKIQQVVERNKDEVVNELLKVVFKRYGNS